MGQVDFKWLGGDTLGKIKIKYLFNLI